MATCLMSVPSNVSVTDGSNTQPRPAASLEDLDENQKRWLVIGISLNNVLSPVLRKYIDPIVTLLYNTLKTTHQIHTQCYPRVKQIYGPRNSFLNYESINNNKTTFGRNSAHYDFRVQSPVDLSKLFLQPHMAKFTAFDETCDMSALLGIIINIDQFPSKVQYKAKEVRSDIRNPWAHCNFKEWNFNKYLSTFRTLEEFVKMLSVKDEANSIQELMKWKTSGIHFTQKISAELQVDLIRDIHSHTQSLSATTASNSDSLKQRLQSLEKILDTRIRNLEHYYKDIEIKVEALWERQKQFSCHCQDFHQLEIKSWFKQDLKFVETKVIMDIIEKLKTEHTAMVTGTSGIGKSATVHHIALLLSQRNSSTIIPCHTPQEITTHFRQNDYQIFVIDDICGKCTISDIDVENWIKYKCKIRQILDKGKTKLLCTCRLEIFREDKFTACSDTFGSNIFDLSSNYLLSEQENIIIAGKYLREKDVKMLKCILPKIHFSPLSCSLFANNNHFSLEEFMKAPFKLFCNEWNQLKHYDRTKYFVLLLFVIFNGCVHESILTDTGVQNERVKLEDLYNVCRIDRGTPKYVIKDKIESCLGSYFKKDGSCYRVIHDKMFDHLCCYFGEEMISNILKYADCKLICERTQLQSIKDTYRENTILIPEVVENEFFSRVQKEFENGNIHILFSSPQMKYRNYREKLINVLKSLGAKSIKRLMNQTDGNRNSALIIVCLRGYDDIASLFIKCGAKVNTPSHDLTPMTAACKGNHQPIIANLIKAGSQLNHTDSYGDTPLYSACIGGFLITVKNLIQKGAHINQAVTYGGTPLYGASAEGHEHIVKYLIFKNAKVNKTIKYGDTPLYAACSGGFRSIVQVLIDNGACVNESAKCSGSPLYEACSKGDDIIAEMLMNNGADVNKNGNDTDTPLISACLGGHEKIVDLLIKRKPNVNKRKADGRTPLHIASKIGNTAILKILVDNGSEINSVYGMGYTSLYEACLGGHDKALRILIRKGANVNQATCSQETPLHIACREGFGEIVKVLLDSGADIEFPNSKKETPLYVACSNNHFDIVQMLIRKGVSINKSNETNETPLYVACCNGYDHIVQILIDTGAEISTLTVYGWSALYASSSSGYEKIVKLLIDNGANVNEKISNGWTPLGAASCEGHTRTVGILLESGVSVNQTNENGETPLYVSCAKGHSNICQLLICKDSDINKSKFGGQTPLHRACESGWKGTAEILMKNGAVIEKADDNGETSLHLATTEAHVNIVELLIRKGADINRVNNKNETPLYKACKMGHVKVVQLLLCHGAKAEIASSSGSAAFFAACSSGYDEIVSLFIEKNIDLNQSYTNGWTPLCISCNKGHYSTTELLIKHGADLNKQNNRGFTPLRCALSENKHKIADLLLDKGANDVLEEI